MKSTLLAPPLASEDADPLEAPPLEPFDPLPLLDFADLAHSGSPAQWPTSPQAEHVEVRFLSDTDREPVNFLPKVRDWSFFAVTVRTSATEAKSEGSRSRS